MFLWQVVSIGIIFKSVYLVEFDENNNAIDGKNAHFPDYFSKLPFHNRENKTECYQHCGSHYDAACRTRGQYYIDGSKDYNRKNFPGSYYIIFKIVLFFFRYTCSKALFSSEN